MNLFMVYFYINLFFQEEIILRDINRIGPFLDKFQELWELCPDLRFGQLVYIVAGKMKINDIFAPEEDEFMAAIEELIDEHKYRK